jgi:hypothetical protein
MRNTGIIPAWSAKLHYDDLLALLGETEVPSYRTVRRYMASQGLWKPANDLLLVGLGASKSST